jgi:hypothetical protein
LLSEPTIPPSGRSSSELAFNYKEMGIIEALSHAPPVSVHKLLRKWFINFVAVAIACFLLPGVEVCIFSLCLFEMYSTGILKIFLVRVILLELEASFSSLMAASFILSLLFVIIHPPIHQTSQVTC